MSNFKPPSSVSAFGTARSEKLRVLHVGNFFAPHLGGIETHLGTLATTLSDVLSLRFLVANHEGRQTRVELRGDPYWLVRLGMPARPAGAPLLPGLFDWMQQLQGELTEIHHPHPMGFLAWLLLRPPGPLIVRYHSEIVRQRVLRRFAYPLLQAVFAQAAAIVPTSPRLADAPELSRVRHKVVPIPLGIMTREFAPTAKSEGRADSLRQSVGVPFALLLGRHVSYKGAEVLLAALRGDERLHTVLVGEGPLTPRLQRLVAKWGLERRVRFVPSVPAQERLAWLRAATVLVLPSVSRNEAFGLVLLEAFACGTPAISTELGTGTSWVNRHRETGLVVEPRNPAALAEALSELLLDPIRARDLGEAARERVREHFDAERVMRPRTLELYRQMAGFGHVSQPDSRSEHAEGRVIGVHNDFSANTNGSEGSVGDSTSKGQ